jgi:hypothetical protein
VFAGHLLDCPGGVEIKGLSSSQVMRAFKTLRILLSEIVKDVFGNPKDRRSLHFRLQAPVQLSLLNRLKPQRLAGVDDEIWQEIFASSHGWSTIQHQVYTASRHIVQCTLSHWQALLDSRFADWDLPQSIQSEIRSTTNILCETHQELLHWSSTAHAVEAAVIERQLRCYIDALCELNLRLQSIHERKT